MADDDDRGARERSRSRDRDGGGEDRDRSAIQNDATNDQQRNLYVTSLSFQVRCIQTRNCAIQPS